MSSQPDAKSITRPSGLEYQPLPDRKLSRETCKFFGYKVDKVTGDQYEVYPETTGQINAYKVRSPNKDFRWIGKPPKDRLLFGMSKWPNKGRRIIITEGAIDCMTVSQAQGHKWPVVSITNGASSAHNDVASCLEWLSGYEEVVLWFDNDRPGKEAAEKTARILPPGTVYIVQQGRGKDASDLYQLEGAEAVRRQAWQASRYMPEGLTRAKDILDTLTEIEEIAMPWKLPGLTELTHGRKYGELITIGAGTGSGKTDFIYEEMAFLLGQGESVGLFSFESDARDTLKHIAGKLIEKRIHVPDPDGLLWTKEDLDHAVTALGETKGELYLNNNFGHSDWETIKTRIRYLHHACGVSHFVLDPMTALVATFKEDERRAIDIFMADLAQLTVSLGICTYLVCHLTTPSDGAHEEGARVKIRDFKGSRSIGAWSMLMIAIERDTQTIGGATTLRILKQRRSGNSVGQCLKYGYNPMTGMIIPNYQANPEQEETYGDF